MTEHFPTSTVSCSLWCTKCQKYTQHRIDGVRKGPCLDCIAKRESEHAQNAIARAELERQKELFE